MPAPAQAPSRADQQSGPPQVLIPFTAAAHEHTEPGGFQFAVTPGANPQAFGPFDVPAFGFLRHLVIEVTTTAAGTAGAGVLHADSPFTVFSSISLNDVNGAPMFGPYTGYETLWANIAGGYVYVQDPRRLPGFVNSLTTFSFLLRIPVEISHFDGLGCIANQNAAAAYKVYLTVDTVANIYATAPTTPPTLQVTGRLEAWTLPNATDVLGRPQQQFPNAHGTTQYWTKFIKPIAAGQNSILLPRVGNMIRNIVLLCRTAGGVRADNVFADPVRLSWDQRDLLNESQYYRVNTMFEKVENLSSRDVGVFHYSFNHPVQGRTGDAPPTLWLPTVGSTRLEFTGVSGAAGSIVVLTNDVAPAEVNPAQRFVEGSRTGGTPGSAGSHGTVVVGGSQ